MYTNLYLGKNISKLPLSHCGSIYLMPEQSTFGLLGLDRFEKFVVNWCNSIGVVDVLAGTLERGKLKGVNHLQWVAVADESLPFITKDYLGVSDFEYYEDKKLVKSQDKSAISGFSDKYHNVEGVKIKSANAIISVEPIIDKISASNYTFKFASWGINTVYYSKY